MDGWMDGYLFFSTPYSFVKLVLKSFPLIEGGKVYLSFSLFFPFHLMYDHVLLISSAYDIVELAGLPCPTLLYSIQRTLGGVSNCSHGVSLVQ